MKQFSAIAVKQKPNREFIMTRDEMKARTKAYANRIVKLCLALPNNWVARTLGEQLLRAGTSVGANYRAVCRANQSPISLTSFVLLRKE